MPVEGLPLLSFMKLNQADHRYLLQFGSNTRRRDLLYRNEVVSSFLVPRCSATTPNCNLRNDGHEVIDSPHTPQLCCDWVGESKAFLLIFSAKHRIILQKPPLS